MKKYLAFIVSLSVIGILIYHFFPFELFRSAKDLNIVFISIDTLRADRLSCFGYPKNTSPEIDRISKEAVSFNNAMICSTFTAPSHASMLTGLYPSSHGNLTNGYVLPAANLTLAEALKKSGYNTAAFVAAKGILGKQFGFAQGFDYFSEGDTGTRKAEEVTVELLNWLDQFAEKDKFFIWVHYYDVHCDYKAPAPYYNMYYSDYAGGLDPTSKCGKADYNKMDLNEDDFSFINALYDGEIRYVDHSIGILYRKLLKLGIMDHTIFIITSDHGELLGERELIGHNLSVYDTEIVVPLIIRHPELESAGKIIPDQVESIAIMPAILDMVDVKVDRNYDAAGLFPLLKNKELKTGVGYSETAMEKGMEQFVCSRTVEWKCIWNETSNNFELYSLQDDPGELNNLADEEKPLTDLQKNAFLQWTETKKKYSRDKLQEISESVKDNLKTLGYVNQ